MSDFVLGIQSGLRGLQDARRSPATRRAYRRYLGLLILALLSLTVLSAALVYPRIPDTFFDWLGKNAGSWSLDHLEGRLQNLNTHLDALQVDLDRLQSHIDANQKGGAHNLPPVEQFIAERLAFWSPVLINLITLALLLFIFLLFIPMTSLVVVNAIAPSSNNALFLSVLQETQPRLHRELIRGPGRPFPINARFAARRLAAYCFLSVPIFAIGCIPVIGGILGGALQLWLTAHNLSWEILEPYFERRGFTWQQQRQFLRQHRALRLGFAAPFALLIGVPVVGVVLLGYAQASVARFPFPENPR